MDWKEFEIYITPTITATIALLSSFGGAYSAYFLSNYKENKKEKLRNVNAINSALFTLIRQHNVVASMEKEIAGYDTDFNLAFNMPAYKNPEYKDLIQKFDNLLFIHPQVLLELSVEQARFEQAMDAISIRTKFYVNQFLPQVEKHGLNTKDVSAEEMKNTLGMLIYETCINYARDMKEHIMESGESIPEMKDSLFKVATELFPRHEFIK